MPKPDHRSRMALAWLHFHAARKLRGSGVQPRVSTGRSIHAVPSITPSPREGIGYGPRLPETARLPAKLSRAWLRPLSRRQRQPAAGSHVALAGAAHGPETVDHAAGRRDEAFEHQETRPPFIAERALRAISTLASEAVRLHVRGPSHEGVVFREQRTAETALLGQRASAGR